MKTAFLPSALLALLLLVTMQGCVTFPPAMAPRPALRSVGDPGVIVPGAYSLSVNMEDSSTAGSGAAMRRELAAIIEDMLARRGYTRSDDDAEYAVTFSYVAGTRRFTEWRTEVSEAQTTTTSWEAQERIRRERERGQREQGKNAPGPRDRRKDSVVVDTVIVGTTEKTNTTTTVNESTEQTRHTFVATLEVDDRDGALWQADARWESVSPDVLPQVFLPLKHMLFALPSRPAPVRVDRVRAGMGEIFYRQFCEHRRFSTPAFAWETGFGEWDDGAAVHNPEAFQAYVDLLEYAQDALPLLPRGSDYAEMSPDGRADAWRFGGEYFLGEEQDPVQVLVTVEDNGQGCYTVTDARVVSRGEFIGFLDELERWREARDGKLRIFE